MQLFDHKKKIESIIEQLKGQDENSSLMLNTEEIKESHQHHDQHIVTLDDGIFGLKY